MDLGVDLDDPSQLAGVDDLLDLAEGLALAALEADLDDPPGLVDRVDHRLALADVIGDRFLTADVKPFAAKRPAIAGRANAGACR